MIKDSRCPATARQLWPSLVTAGELRVRWRTRAEWVTHWKSGWTRVQCSPVSCAWSLPGRFPRGLLQRHRQVAGLWHIPALFKRTGGAPDSPTDCPAVYESFLVRERLLPLVFAVRKKQVSRASLTLVAEPIFYLLNLARFSLENEREYESHLYLIKWQQC